jgi:hypothetical protein
VLGRIFVPTRKLKKAGGKFIMRSFIICIPHQILEWQIKGDYLGKTRSTDLCYQKRIQNSGGKPEGKRPFGTGPKRNRVGS